MSGRSTCGERRCLRSWTTFSSLQARIWMAVCHAGSRLLLAGRTMSWPCWPLFPRQQLNLFPTAWSMHWTVPAVMCKGHEVPREAVKHAQGISNGCWETLLAVLRETRGGSTSEGIGILEEVRIVRIDLGNIAGSLSATLTTCQKWRVQGHLIGRPALGITPFAAWRLSVRRAAAPGLFTCVNDNDHAWVLCTRISCQGISSTTDLTRILYRFMSTLHC